MRMVVNPNYFAFIVFAKEKMWKTKSYVWARRESKRKEDDRQILGAVWHYLC